MHEQRSALGALVVDGFQRIFQDGRHPRVVARSAGWSSLVTSSDCTVDPDEFVDRLDHVLDGRHAAVRQRHQPGGHHLDLLAGGRAPVRRAGQRSGAQVENPLVVEQFAVADVERLVVDQQADDLAVGDVDERLAGLRVAVSGLGVRQRPDLVEGVQVGARQAVRLALVEVAAQPDVPVGQGEHRLGLGQQVEVELGLADLPRLDGEALSSVIMTASSSARSVTTTSAPLRRNVFGLAHPVDADHAAEVTGPAGLHAGRARPRTRPPRSAGDVEQLGRRAGTSRVRACRRCALRAG